MRTSSFNQRLLPKDLHHLGVFSATVNSQASPNISQVDSVPSSRPNLQHRPVRGEISESRWFRRTRQPFGSVPGI